MEILEKASKSIIIIIIIINKIIRKIIIFIKKIVTIPVIRVIKIITSITKIPTIRGVITTPDTINTSIRITILKLVISSERTRNPTKIIKKYPLRFQIILLRLRRGS